MAGSVDAGPDEPGAAPAPLKGPQIPPDSTVFGVGPAVPGAQVVGHDGPTFAVKDPPGAALK